MMSRFIISTLRCWRWWLSGLFAIIDYWFAYTSLLSFLIMSGAINSLSEYFIDFRIFISLSGFLSFCQVFLGCANSEDLIFQGFWEEIILMRSRSVIVYYPLHKMSVFHSGIKDFWRTRKISFSNLSQSFCVKEYKDHTRWKEQVGSSLYFQRKHYRNTRLVHGDECRLVCSCVHWNNI